MTAVKTNSYLEETYFICDDTLGKGTHLNVNSIINVIVAYIIFLTYIFHYLYECLIFIEFINFFINYKYNSKRSVFKENEYGIRIAPVYVSCTNKKKQCL